MAMNGSFEPVKPYWVPVVWPAHMHTLPNSLTPSVAAPLQIKTPLLKLPISIDLGERPGVLLCPLYFSAHPGELYATVCIGHADCNSIVATLPF